MNSPRSTRKALILFSGGLLLCRLIFLSSLLFESSSAEDATSSTAQSSSPFIEPNTGLPMERFFGARTTFGFAFTFPDSTTPSSSFIGQLSFPLRAGTGWGAMGLTGDMEGNFILAVWPDGKGEVMASFRQATDEDNPPEVKGNFAVRPITEGVAVNDTFLTYTFLCENCLDPKLGLGSEATGADATMGWALSEKAPRGNAADPGAILGFHERGFGPFTARLGSARAPQAQFDAVAATAATAVETSSRARAPTPGAFQDGDESEDEEEDSGSSGDADDDEDDDDDDDADGNDDDSSG